MIQIQNILAQYRNRGGEARIAAEWLQSKIDTLNDEQILSMLKDTQDSGMNPLQVSALQKDFLMGKWSQFYTPTIKATVENLLQEMRLQYERVGLY